MDGVSSMIDNPLEMNDWPIGEFIKVFFTIQFIVLILAILSILGYDIPVLRQIIGFIYLSFIPGIIILRILRLHRLGSAETLLYSVGLSLAFIMFLGFLINSIYPFIGISRPISIWPLIINLTIVLSILSFVAYKRDKTFSTPNQFQWSQILTPPVLFLLLLPLISILGARVVNIYNNNILLLVSVPVIALVAILVIFTRFIPQKFYPLAIMMIAFSLVYGQALISNYLTGADVNVEYFFANLVKTNSLWNTTIVHNYNAAASVVILIPTYSIICGMDLTWVFKIISLFFLSLVPVGLYQVYSRQISGKTAFLAALFFMSVFTFFIELISLTRQDIAELFLVLIVLVIVSKHNNRLVTSILLIVFSAALIISHYSVSFISLLLFAAALFILFLIRNMSILGLLRTKIIAKGDQQSQFIEPDPVKGKYNVLNISIVIFCLVLWLAWYMWHSGSSAFIDVVKIGNLIVSTVVTEFLSLTSSQALWLVATARSPVHEIVKYLNLFTIFLISIGILYLLFRWKKKDFDEEFSALSVASFILVAAALPIPYLARTINTERLYQFSLIFLAPFCITGLIIIAKFFFRKCRSAENIALKTMAIFLGLFLIFNSGFIHEVTKTYVFMGSLLQQSIRDHGTPEEKTYFYTNYTPEKEVFSARWLSLNIVTTENTSVYATYAYGGLVNVLASYGMIPVWKMIPLDVYTLEVPSGSYIYLQYMNIVEGIGSRPMPPYFQKIEIFDIRELSSLISRTNRIYANPGSEILLMP